MSVTYRLEYILSGVDTETARAAQADAVRIIDTRYRSIARPLAVWDVPTVGAAFRVEVTCASVIEVQGIADGLLTDLGYVAPVDRTATRRVGQS